MSSLQQSPAVGQAVPPTALIDGVSQQQIGAAVKKHVRVRKGAPRNDRPEVSRKDVVVSAGLTYLQAQLESLERVLVSDCERGDSGVASPMLDVMSLAIEGVQRMRSQSFANEDEFWERFRGVSGLCHCLSAAYDIQDTPAARILAILPRSVEVISGLVGQEMVA